MSDKIKIIYLIDTFYRGGAEKLLYDLCRKIDKDKFEIEVAAVICGGSLEQDFKDLNVPVRVFTKKGKLGLLYL